MKCNFDCKYDIVTDPIADDDMTILFRQYQNNLISLDSPHPAVHIDFQVSDFFHIRPEGNAFILNSLCYDPEAFCILL